MKQRKYKNNLKFVQTWGRNNSNYSQDSLEGSLKYLYLSIYK